MIVELYNRPCNLKSKVKESMAITITTKTPFFSRSSFLDHVIEKLKAVPRIKYSVDRIYGCTELNKRFALHFHGWVDIVNYVGFFKSHLSTLSIFSHINGDIGHCVVKPITDAVRWRDYVTKCNILLHSEPRSINPDEVDYDDDSYVYPILTF